VITLNFFAYIYVVFRPKPLTACMQKNLISLSIAVLLFNIVASSQTLTCGTSSVTFTYAGASVTYGTVTNPATGRCWLDRNLGASQVATSSTDPLAYGDLFQWGRGDDGHQLRASTTTTTTSSTSVPGHGEFIVGSGDWRFPSNNSSWQGVNGINNPCPSGWRIPTLEELEAEMNSWSSQSNIGAFASPLKLPMAGERFWRDGSFNINGPQSAYWTSTPSASVEENARVLFFDASSSAMLGRTQAFGMSVRCIKACPAETGAGTLSGNQTICIGTTSSFSSTVSGGTWSSSNTTIATVNTSTGLVTGVSGGTTTISYTIAGTGSCPAVTTTRAITVTAATTFNTSSITICPNSAYQVALTTASPVSNGWSCTGAGISVTDGFITTGSSTGAGTVNYTDGCNVTVSAVVNVTEITYVNKIVIDRVGAYRYSGSPQGPVLSGTAINYVGYDGYTYGGQSRPSDVGFYRANIQSGSAAGCPTTFYIYNCTTCTPIANEHVYSTEPRSVQIGTQVWMADNLNVSTYRNGNPIAEVTDAGTWTSTTSGAWSWYDNSATNGASYGKLYNGYAVRDPRELCPSGWRMPTFSDFAILTSYLGANPGQKMKATTSWTVNAGTNQSGFSGLAAGYRSQFGFSSLGTTGFFAAGSPNIFQVNVFYLDPTDFFVTNQVFHINSGVSIRCIKQ
jgi:uncharacterized protein (TIGR02145 family)